MSWEQTTLGELIHVKHGFAFKGEHFTDSGKLILLTPGNCYESGGLKLKGEKEKYYSGEFPKEYLLSENDLIIVMTDLINTAPILGGAFIIPQNERFLHNQRLGLVSVKDYQKLDKKFLYYILNEQTYRAQVRGSASGATVRHTAPERIYRCEVKIPLLAVQQKIAGILSAYDDFIDNNRKRITLLEKAARLLYEEWFVRLQFPGHEHTPVVDEVPQGWERKVLSDVIELNYGKALKSDNRIAGEFPVYGSSGEVGTHNRAIVKGPAIIVGRKGNVGSIFWSSKSCYPIDTVYYINTEQISPFIYYNLQYQHFINNDGAVPGLNRSYAYSRPILMPSNTLLAQFNSIAQATIDQIEKLSSFNQKLQQTRDLLLPRLMSGELAV